MSTDVEGKAAPTLSTTVGVKVDNELGLVTTNNDGEIQTIHHRIDKAVERSYLRKLDFYLLPLLSLMYLFNSVDRVRSAAPELGPVDCTDRVFSRICQMPKRTGSTQICISMAMNTPFCCCFSTFRMALLVSKVSKLDRMEDKIRGWSLTWMNTDMPLNLLTKRFSGKITLPSLMLAWGGLSMIQTACTNFGGMLVIRLLIGFVTTCALPVRRIYRRSGY